MGFKWLLLAALVMSAGCGEEDPDDSGAADDTSADTDADTDPIDTGAEDVPTWEGAARPILQQYCSGCHGNTGCSTGICWADDYAVVSAVATNAVCEGKTRAECIPMRIHDGSMPPGGCAPGTQGCITEAEITRIETWVAAGFPE